MRIMRAETPGPAVSKLLPKVRSTASIMYITYVVHTIMEIVALLLAGVRGFDALCISLSTAGTGGWSAYAGGLTLYNTAAHMIVAFFMLAFGVNFIAYFSLVFRKEVNILKHDEVRWYLSIFAVAAAVLSICLIQGASGIGEGITDGIFYAASFLSSTAYSVGNYTLLPVFGQLIIITLMLIGACAGSTGGGIKVSRVMIFLKTMRKELSFLRNPRNVKVIMMNGKAIDKEIIYSATHFLIAYILIFTLSSLIVSLQNLDIGTTLSAVLASFNNVGVGFSQLGDSSQFGLFSWYSKLVLMFDMLAGRLEIFPLLALMASGFSRK
jgi:trk system potassium uptake protein TrkH